MKSASARAFLFLLLSALAAVAVFPALPAQPAVSAQPASPAQPVSSVIPSIAAHLDKNRLAVGETALLTVEVSWTGAADDLEFDFPSPPDCHLLAVEGSYQESSVEQTPSGPSQLRRYHYQLRAREKGEGRVGYAAVAYRRPQEDESHTLKSEPLDIAVFSARAPLGMLLPAAAVLILAAGAALILRRARQRKLRKAPVAVPTGAEWKAEALLALARAKKLAVEGETAASSRALFQALALFLGKKFGVDINRDSWRQAVGALPPEAIPDGEKKELIEIVQTVEQARFGSRAPAAGEGDALIKRIRSLIEEEA